LKFPEKKKQLKKVGKTFREIVAQRKEGSLTRSKNIPNVASIMTLNSLRSSTMENV